MSMPECANLRPTRVISLEKGWVFRQADCPEEAFLEAHDVPMEIFRDLIFHKKIPEPFLEKNEALVQWVGSSRWLYRTVFERPEMSNSTKIILAFDGLDTFATVSCNSQVILENDNMFIPSIIDVTKILMPGRNVLEIAFDSPLTRGKELVHAHSRHRWGCWNGPVLRLATRKAQYHYGWDWGPSLPTCGPWRPVNLITYHARIDELSCSSNISDTLDSAEIHIRAKVEGVGTDVAFEVTLDGRRICSATASIENDLASISLVAPSPELWYPWRYGRQPLYKVVATLSCGHQKLDTKSKRIGLRKLELIQKKLKEADGTSFFFKVNSVPIFAGGCNWIPCDSFLTRIKPERYKRWVSMARDSNQVMLRVWGGGIYEHEAFYDACDEMGLLVWQDFMFACGNYPAHPDFLDLVEREAITNVVRLRHHPSIVLWAGNNEDYTYAETEGLSYDPKEQDPQVWLRSDFPARYIYEKLLKDIVHLHNPDALYHLGSPFGGAMTSDSTVGDIHQWNVWHGTQEKYQDFDKLMGRFVSEFGLEAHPDTQTIEDFFASSDSPEYFPESFTTAWHNKAAGHERRLAIYLSENVSYRMRPWQYYVFCTQVVQAECIRNAISLWRRQWKGQDREYCGGALIWQLNDCWPCTSWSLVDYFLRPKLAFYALKREMQGITIGLKRYSDVIDSRTRSFEDSSSRPIVQLWVSNLDLTEHELDLHISSANLDDGKVIEHPSLATVIRALPNKSIEVCSFDLPGASDPNQTVVCAELTDRTGRMISRGFSWPEPLKYAHMQETATIEARIARDIRSTSKHDTTPGREDCEHRTEMPSKRGTLCLLANRPLKSVSIKIEGQDNQAAQLFGDNGFDLMPGKVHTVHLSGLETSPIFRVVWLGKAVCEGHEFEILPVKEVTASDNVPIQSV